MKTCSHLSSIQKVHPSAKGCDDSALRHATKHFKSSGHPVIEGYDPPEGWGWCFIDHVTIDLGTDTTRQDGPIPRFY